MALLIRRETRRLQEGLLRDHDADLIADAEMLAGDDAAAVAWEVDGLQRALRRRRAGARDEQVNRRITAARLRLRAFVDRRRRGHRASTPAMAAQKRDSLPVSMLALWRGCLGPLAERSVVVALDAANDGATQVAIG